MAKSDWLVVTAAFSINLVFGIFNSFGVFFKPLGEEFGWLRTETSAVYSIYTVSYSIFALPMGRLADRRGSRTTLLLGAALIGVGLSLSSQIQSLWQLYVMFGFLGGAGAGAFWLASISHVARWFSRSRRLGVALAITTMGSSVGQAVVPPIAERLISAYGWRNTFTILGLSFMTIAILAAFVLVERKNNATGNFQEGISHGSSEGWSLGDAIHTRAFWSIFSIWMLGYFTGTMVTVHFVPSITDMGIHLQDASISQGLIGVGINIGRTLSVSLGPRLTERNMMAGFLVIQAAAIPLLMRITEVSGVHLAATIFGIGYGGWLLLLPITLQKFFGSTRMGSILGAGNSSFGVGGLLGPIFGGFIYDAFKSYEPAFVVGTAILLMAGLVGYSTKKPSLPKSAK